MRACIDVSTVVEKDSAVGVMHTVCCTSGTLLKLLDLLDGAGKGFSSKKKQAGGLGPSVERRHAELSMNDWKMEEVEGETIAV